MLNDREETAIKYTAKGPGSTAVLPDSFHVQNVVCVPRGSQDTIDHSELAQRAQDLTPQKPG